MTQPYQNQKKKKAQILRKTHAQTKAKDECMKWMFNRKIRCKLEKHKLKIGKMLNVEVPKIATVFIDLSYLTRVN